MKYLSTAQESEHVPMSANLAESMLIDSQLSCCLDTDLAAKTMHHRAVGNLLTLKCERIDTGGDSI